MGILMNNGLPQGGEWTYDKYNREKYPKDKKTPKISFHVSHICLIALYLILKNIFKQFRLLTPTKNLYPHDFNTSRKWLL